MTSGRSVVLSGYSEFELTTLVVIATDCIGNRESSSSIYDHVHGGPCPFVTANLEFKHVATDTDTLLNQLKVPIADASVTVVWIFCFIQLRSLCTTYNPSRAVAVLRCFQFHPVAVLKRRILSTF